MRRVKSFNEHDANFPARLLSNLEHREPAEQQGFLPPINAGHVTKRSSEADLMEGMHFNHPSR